MNRQRWRILVAAALITGILYWVGGAHFGAGLAQRQLQELLAGATTQVLTLDDLRFNPFTLTARFAGLRVDDADAETGPVLTAATGHLSLAFNGLIGNAITVSDMLLDEPRLVVATSSRFDNHQLRTLGGLLPGDTDTLKRPPIRIAHAQITNGHLSFYHTTDSGLGPVPMVLHIGDIQLGMSNLNTAADAAATFDLAARINESGVLDAQGSWVPASHIVEAGVKLNGLVLTPFTALFNMWHPDTQLAGVLAVDGEFKYVADNPGFTGALVVEDLAVNDHRGESVVNANRVTAHGMTLGNKRKAATIQWLELDRPGVAVIMGEDGTFNLSPSTVSSLVNIDRVTVRDGHVGFTDARLPSTTPVGANKIVGELTRSVSQSRQTLTMSLTGALAANGTATVEGVYHTIDDKVQAAGNIALAGVDARVVSAYVQSAIARDITGGLMDLNLKYAIDANSLVASSKIELADLELGVLTQDEPASSLPVDLAVALLTDENRRMVVELPVKVDLLDSGSAVQQGFGDALTKFIVAHTTEPVSIVARLAGTGVSEAERFEFVAGSPESLPEVEHQLATLVDVLNRRPLLGVRLQGHYAKRSDREALALRQVELHIGLAASTSMGNSSVASGLDFADPKVQAVLDEFAAARLDASERSALIMATQQKDVDTAGATPSYYPAVFKALVAKESVSDYALRQLARYRARSLVGRLQEMGIETERLEVDKSATPEKSDDAPPAVTMTPIAYGLSGE